MRRKVALDGYSDHELLSGLGINYADDFKVKGAKEGRAKGSMVVSDEKDYATAAEMAGGVAMLDYLGRGERLQPVGVFFKGKRKEERIEQPFPVTVEAGVVKREGNTAVVNFSLLNPFGSTIDSGQVKYRVLRKPVHEFYR